MKFTAESFASNTFWYSRSNSCITVDLPISRRSYSIDCHACTSMSNLIVTLFYHWPCCPTNLGIKIGCWIFFSKADLCILPPTLSIPLLFTNGSSLTIQLLAFSLCFFFNASISSLKYPSCTDFMISPFQLIEYLLETLSRFVYHLCWCLSSSRHSEATFFYNIMQLQWFFPSWTSWILFLTDDQYILDDST